MISEKIELLGKGVYKNIPDVLTLKALPTSSELDYVGAEDFDRTMIDKILPRAVEEKINFNELLEIDYQWICRCLRLVNYGPYHTTNSIYCPDCGKRHIGDYQVDLRSIDCIPLPDGFKNSVTVGKDAFLDFDSDIKAKLLTIREIIDAYEDKAFKMSDGTIDRDLARSCYMITAVGEQSVRPIEAKLILEEKMSSADYMILKDELYKLTNYGLRAGGTVKCPVCGSTRAAYVALTDDRFFRCTVDNLRKWRDDRRAGRNKDVLRDTPADVREHS